MEVLEQTPEEQPEEVSIKEISTWRRLYLFVYCYWRSLVILSTPFLLVPILLLGTGKFVLAIYMIVLMAIWWVTEAIPFAITSLLPVIVFPLMQIMSLNECCLNFISDYSITFLGTFMVGQAFEYSLLDQRIALILLRKFGCRPLVLHTLLIASTFFLSMWVIDMAVVAIMCPIVKAILRELETHGLCSQYELGRTGQPPRPSKTALSFYLGVSMAATFGGCSTLVGTGANLVMVRMYLVLFNKQMPFLAFMFYTMPVMLTLVMLSMIYLQWRFLGLCGKETADCKITEEGLQETQTSVENEYESLDRVSFHEKVVLIVTILMMLLLISRKPIGSIGWNNWLFEG